jgi:chaperone required for assembly of F1-ATPase
MRELFETISPENPIEAARRGLRQSPRRRFYEKATSASTTGGYSVLLDAKPLHTPARRLLSTPTEALAQAIAEEWNAQTDLIDPAAMPLTRLANAIIDGVAEASGRVAEEVAKYLASDLLFYRAASPQGLVERQARHWDPVLAWTRDELGLRFEVGRGVVHVAQPEEALTAAGALIPKDPWRVGGLYSVTTLTGSALLALALLRGALSADAAWQAAHVDEDWNIEQWGRDETAMQRRAYRLAEFEAAVAVMRAAA